MKKIDPNKLKYFENKKIYIARHKKRRKNKIRNSGTYIVPPYKNKQKKSIKVMVAPQKFSLLTNTEKVLNYFNNCIKLYEQGHMVHYNLEGVKDLTFETIILMIAVLQDEVLNNKLSSSGTLPLNKTCKQLLINSGFLQALKNKDKKWSYDSSGKMIHHLHQTKKSNTIVSGHVTQEVINYTFSGKLYQKLHPVFIECMTNTKDHASEGLNHKFDWWLSYYKEPNTNITKICFVDLGAGILSTLNKNWLVDWGKYGVFTNKKKLESILNRIIKEPSRMNEKKRGKGLPFINDFSKNEEVKNFTMITNGVYGDLSNQRYKGLKNKLRGTLYSWELHPLDKN